MSEIEQILEELAITYEQLSIFYDWNEQFSSTSFNSSRISQVLAKLITASQSETALLISLSKGASQKLVASSCETFDEEQLALDRFNSLIPMIEPRLEYDFTINEELESTYFIIIPWKQEEGILGVFVFSRSTAPYSHQENVLLGNTCTEFGIMLKNKSLNSSLKERNLEIIDLLKGTVENLSFLMENCRSSMYTSPNYQQVMACVEETYLKHLLTQASVIESIYPVQAKRTDNMRTICKIIGTQLRYDEKAQQNLDLAARLCDISFSSMTQETYANYLATGTINLDPKMLEVIRFHPHLSAKMLAPVNNLEPVARIISCHHEYYDGSGYPEGLEGEQIPESSQILSLAHQLAHRSEHHYKSVIDLLDLPEERSWLIKKTKKIFSPKLIKALFEGLGLQSEIDS